MHRLTTYWISLAIFFGFAGKIWAQDSKHPNETQLSENDYHLEAAALSDAISNFRKTKKNDNACYTMSLRVSELAHASQFPDNDDFLEMALFFEEAFNIGARLDPFTAYDRLLALTIATELSNNIPDRTNKVFNVLIDLQNKSEKTNIESCGELLLASEIIFGDKDRTQKFIEIVLVMIKEEKESCILALLRHLRRNGPFDVLKALMNKEEIQNFLRLLVETDTEKLNEKTVFFEEERQNSLFSILKPDLLENIDLQLIDPENLVIAQNELKTILQLTNGELLILNGQEGKAVYAYLHEKTGKGSIDTKNLYQLGIHTEDGHGFVSIRGLDIDTSAGLYPSDEDDEEAIGEELIASSYRDQFLLQPQDAFKTSKIIRFPKSHSKIFTLGSGSISAIFMADSNCKGRIINEYRNIRATYPNHLNSVSTLSFIINKARAQKAANYIYSAFKDCENNREDSLCIYSFLNRNCFGFATEVFHEAGFSGWPIDFFTKEQFGIFDAPFYNLIRMTVDA